MKNKIMSSLLLAILLIGTLAIAIPNVAAATTQVRVIPSPIDLGTGHVNVIGTEFDVAVVVENVENLYGLSVKVYINETYFQYVSHTTTIPWNTTQTPVPPSPYGGILYAPVVKAKDEYNPATHILEVSYSSQAPAAPFTGSGTVCIIRIRVIDQPFDYEVLPDDYIEVLISLVEVKLAGYGIPPPPIPFDSHDGVVHLWWRPFEYPKLPKLKILPTSHTGSAIGEIFNYDVYLLGEDDTDLSSFWDVAGIDFILNFDPALIEATDATIDPEGWFATFWPHGVYEITKKINNTEGTVHIAFLGIPGAGGVHTPPFGQGKIATITFNVTYLHIGYPPPSCTLFLKNPEPRPSIGIWGPEFFKVDVAGFPHPERTMEPWNGAPYAVPIPHVVANATYTAPYKMLGAAIDVFTQYPYPFGGQEPNNPSDMFWPQKEVILFAKVTYNGWPEQQKDVAFQVIDPYGVNYTLLCARTNASGIATTSFRLPWMCDDPTYYFGEWTVIATVDVACTVYNDTLTFKYDYLVHIWKVSTDKTEYPHYDEITVRIEYGSAAMQEYDILLTATGLDETGVPFDFEWTWITAGNAIYCTYENNTAVLHLYIPKWARAGAATIQVNALRNWPSLGGDQAFPAAEIQVGIKAE
jgi:hypothetical protein